MEKFASLYNIHLRTGCLCNPGACQKYLNISEETLIQQFKVVMGFTLTYVYAGMYVCMVHEKKVSYFFILILTVYYFHYHRLDMYVEMHMTW